MPGIHMLETGMVLHAHHWVLWLRRASITSSISFFALVIIVIVTAMLVCVVLRALMLVRTTIILKSAEYLVDIR